MLYEVITIAVRLSGAVPAKLVILSPLVGILQHIVRFADFLEFLFGCRIVGMPIRMRLLRQLPIRLFDFLLAGGFRDMQYFVA